MARNFWILNIFVIVLPLNGVSSAVVSLGSLETWNFNGLRSEKITILNLKQMKIKDLHFVDEGPAVWFMVGTDEDDYKKEFSSLDGVIIPDEDGSCKRLKGYDDSTVTLTLPGTLKWSDFNYLSVFCVRFNHNFGYVTIPHTKLNLIFGNDTKEAVANLPKYCPQDVEGRVPPDGTDDDDR